MILVTGGTGLVGSHLLVDLIEKGYAVKALRRKGSQLGLIKRLFDIYSKQPVEAFSCIHWINGDMLDISSLEKAMEDVTDVYHCAAIMTFNPKSGRKMIRNNTLGTANVVNTALAKNIRKLCHVSSVISLAQTFDHPIITESAPWKSTRHHPPYAISKVESEREVWRGIAEGLDAVIVNPGVILGHGDPKRDSGRLIPSLSKMTRYYTSGVTGMISIKDVVRAMILLMESDISGERFILSAENVPFQHLTEMVAEALGKPKPSIRIPALALEIAWRMEHLRSLVTGSEPFITKATAQSASRWTYFNGEKITQRLPFQYTPIEQVVREICKKIREEEGLNEG